MALDGIVTRAVVHELQSLVGARIHKIHQPTDHDLVLQIRGGSTPGKLLLSANPTYPRVHFTNQTFINPKEAPMFCMLMRKYCEGGQIEEVLQIGNERIIHMRIRQRDELGDIALKTIIIEIMGRHSNIILVDHATGAIHDGIHHVTPSISSYRIVMPGSEYVAPPEQGKLNPLHITTRAAFESALTEAIPEVERAGDTVLAPVAPDKLLVSAFSGLSPLLAKEIIYRGRLALNPLLTLEELCTAIWPAFEAMMLAWTDHRYDPQNVQPDEQSSGKAAFSVAALTHLATNGHVQSFETVSECLEAFYGDKAQRDTVKQRVSDLIRFLQNERNKNVKKLEKLQETLDEAKDADKFRILGELLTTYMHQFSRGDKQVEVVNYYDEDQQAITIALDPQLTPSENAQRYFKRYNKHKNSLTAVAEQMKQAHQEIAYLESLLQQLESASLSDIDEIREELVEQGYLRDRAKRGPKKKKNARPSLLCYTSSEGIAIYVGKNNTQNDYLTNKTAGPNETWLHTKDIPGSHVVIRATEFGDATLEEAAMLAAHYSQARSSSLVPVDYTLIRYVKKPSGAKPGFVIYDHQKTLFITPDEQRIKSWPSVIKN
ncbi:putative ribosome quality control (RQC) complex YloA/Tae2 family protein [Paenibacillus phyllosphaerae]|uniref:Rqc2 homolog RqcH n=1 Tax=Paenibacillus phyllosphaerae TaxID=274593 RepID=A0A7W5AXM9_9BACL|nr:NFACT RNA binding domain-containing protein [Paenibacillus phyllosphaerae]MBB3110477.1 putative ribosome quality control (RQC) complex YloA/Tae2 family protein [Paenibacillus phyllosphaerae]